MAKKKSGILSDSFEQLGEFGSDTVKKTAKSLAETFIPLSTQSPQTPESPQDKKSKSHTPLNFEKLGSKFKDKEKLKTQALRARLFQLVKGGEEKLLMEEKKKKQEKQRALLWEEQEKKRQEAEKKHMQQQVAPRGKTRKSIFSHKKVAEREHMEVKPSSGKQ